jgi:hypothetical protein
MTDDRSNVSDARYGEAIFYLQLYVRIRFRMCTHARWSHGSICFTTAVIPDFASKTMYSSHVCPGSFIPHTQT